METGIERIQEGESGVRKGNLTEERIEAISDYWGCPETERKERWGEPQDIARLLGISPATVRKAKVDKRVKAQIKDAMENKLLYDVIEARAIALKILHSEKERGDTKIKAWRTLEQMHGTLTSNAPQVNITNDFSTYENLTDEQVSEMYDNYARKRGYLRNGESPTS